MPSAMHMLRTAAPLLAAAALSGVMLSSADWSYGRATHYGQPGDGSIHHGACEYYYLGAGMKTGWDVAALCDSAHDFGGSCGRCYEIECADVVVRDNYGTTLDRVGACRAPGTSIVVQITDACPCNYPPNAWSNRRWCCGDAYHFDLSAWAFSKLAELGHGVVGVRHRQVDCHYQPANRAPDCCNPSSGETPPPGWSPDLDKRPW